MGIFTRGSKLWARYKDEHGKWKNAATPYGQGQEDLAERWLLATKREIARLSGDALAPTVYEYSKTWLERREKEGLVSYSDDEARMRMYVVPRLGGMRLVDIRPRHLANFILWLRNDARCVKRDSEKEARTLAPRTVRHVYFTLVNMLKDAHFEEVISALPTGSLRRGTLPKKKDRNPEFRDKARFFRHEVEALLSSPKIPRDRRMMYAVMFLGGMRFGEIAALRWRHYLPDLKPLGQLTVAWSYNTKLHVEKETKTETPRKVPVHPVLAKMLDEWRKSGFVAMLDRHPGEDDLIIPSREGANRNVNLGLRRFKEDCRALEIEPRRQHDARRTLASLCREGRANKDAVRWCTHGQPREDQLDEYTSFDWEHLCEAISAMKIDVLEGRVVELKRVVGEAELKTTTAETRYSSLQDPTDAEKAPKPFMISGPRMRGGRDLNRRKQPGDRSLTRTSARNDSGSAQAESSNAKDSCNDLVTSESTTDFGDES